MVAIFVASMMLHNPIGYVDLTVAKTVHKHMKISANETDNDEEESAMDELENVMNSLIREVGQNGIELLIGGFATLIVSLLLIQGIRQAFLVVFYFAISVYFIQ